MYHTQENISRGIKIRLWITQYSAIQSVSHEAAGVEVKNGGIGDAGLVQICTGF